MNRFLHKELRDIKVLLNLMENKESLGLPIDHSMYQEFENKTKHLNFLFASGNDFIYEFFNSDNYYLKLFSKKLFKVVFAAASDIFHIFSNFEYHLSLLF